MAYKTNIFLVCILSIASIEFKVVASSEVSTSTRVDRVQLKSVTTKSDYDSKENGTIEKLPASNRVDAESRRIVNPLRLLMSKPRVSPLYLINGTVCRFVNFQPICTTLSTSGLSVGGGGSSRPSGGGTGGGSSGGGGGGSSSGGSGGSRPSGGGSSGGGSGGSSSGSSGGSGGSRPSSSGIQSGGSSVQFANVPTRTQSSMQDERPDMFVERLDNLTDQQQEQQAQVARPLNVIVNRSRLGLFRRPVRYQFVTNRQEDILRQSPSQVIGAKKSIE